MHPDFVIAWRLHPIAPDQTRIICQWLFPPDRIQGQKFDASGAIEFWDMTNRQDWEICQRNFDGISSYGYRPGPYMANEVVLGMLDHLILSALEIEAEPR
jgi:Rieske 2Fe-2S family protein